MDEKKKDLVLGYLTNQLALLPSLSKQYTEGKPTRISFLQLKSAANNFLTKSKNERILLVPGLRGVGKTTLLFQIYEYIKNLLPNIEIIYLTLDVITKQLGSNLQESLEIYENKILNCPLENLEKKIVLLIDEAHYDENWATIIKSVYDRTKNAFVIISGSASLAIESDTDLTRRMYVERIYPLNFPEYLLIKRNVYPRPRLGNEIIDALFNSDEINIAFKKIKEAHQRIIKELLVRVPSLELEIVDFISKGGFPAMLEDIKKEEKVFRRINSVLDKMVYQDILTFYPSCRSNVDKIIPILTAIANSSDRLSYSSLMNMQNIKSKQGIVEIMIALKKAGVIFDLKVGGPPTKMERNSPKYYFASPTIRAALLWNIGKFKKDGDTIGYLMENAVFNTLHKIRTYSPDVIQNISYNKEAGAPDFKVKTKSGEMMIECGWGKKTVKQMKNQNKKKFGIIVSNIKEPKMDKETNSLYVPKEIILLMR